MPREFSADFGSRLGDANIKYLTAIGEFNIAVYSFSGEMSAMEDQFRQIMGQHFQTARTLECLMANGKMEEFERYIEYHKELQAINQLERDIIAEEYSKFNRNLDAHLALRDSMSRMLRRRRALLKRTDIFKKMKLTIQVIKALNTIADEEVSVPRIETENASDKTGGESTTVKVAEREISSGVDDGGSIAGIMEKVEFFADVKLTTSEQQSSEILPGQSSEEQLGEVKQSPSEIDQSSIADRIEAQQELLAVAGSSNNETIELQKSTLIDPSDRTGELVEELTQLEKCATLIRLLKKGIGLPEEASYTDEKSRERLEKLSLHFQELDALFVELETLKTEFLEL